MSYYEIAHWSLCLLSTATLIYVGLFHKSMLIKPSFAVLGLFNLKIQWAAALDGASIYRTLQEPWDFLLLAQVFPVLAMVVSLASFRATAQVVFHRATLLTDHDCRTIPPKAFVAFASLIGMILAWYLWVVPLNETGLYAIVFDHERSDFAREASLATAGGAGLRYSVSFMLSVFCPLFTILTVFRITATPRAKWRRRMLLIAFVTGSVIIVSLTGERSRAVVLLATLFVAHFIRRGLTVKPLKIAIAVFGVLLLPVLLTILREGKEVSLESLFYYYPHLFARAFHGPMYTGTVYAEYVNNHGFFGVAGIPKLALLFGVEPINVPNLIGLMHEGDAIDSVAMNTCFVFHYYSCFGLNVLIPCLLLLLALDSILIMYLRLRREFMVACMATVSFSVTKLADTTYTTVLMTHGTLAALAVCYWLNSLSVSRRSRRRLSTGLSQPRTTAIRTNQAR